MTSIIGYRKVSTPHTVIQIQLPDDIDLHCTELCTLDGITYICLPDGVTLPADQPPEIDASIEIVALTPSLSAVIAAASPHVRLINIRVAEMIAAEYSVIDEIKLLRTAPSAEFEVYNAHAEACRAWGRAEKAKLGLA